VRTLHLTGWVLVLSTLPGRPLAGASVASDPLPPSWDVWSDTWVATDALGRSLPLYEQTGPPRPNKAVGIFYFLWLGQHGDLGPFDISRILAADPKAMDDPNHPSWGPLQAPHHWGESIFGYYVSDDEAVLRKHAQMLADAGVDMVVFDVTNQLTYPRSWQALCRVWDAVRRDGNRTPQIAFLCPFWDPAKVVRDLWDQLYSRNQYPDLWFRWEGRPLLLADRDKLVPDRDGAILEFFTFRKPQPDYFQGPTGPNQWGWLEVYPQHVFTNAAGAAEEMTVGVAQNAVDGRLSVLSNPRSHGRSFHDGSQPGPDGQDFSGRNAAEQWQRALAVDPAFIFITGWNEWIAGRFGSPSGFYADGPVAFVDEFNQEYSRDIEPMAGGHGDSYYYQMVSQIRRFKGARALAPIRPRPIRIDGRFEDWTQVEPEFRDTIGDPVHRDHPGWGKGTRYVNQTGRNDIVAVKVSFDLQAVYFYVRTRQPLTPCTDPNWMLLFLDTDGKATNGWLGYDFVVNRKGVKPDSTTLERHAGHGYRWESVCSLRYRTAGNELELAIPRAAIGLTTLPASLDFKWADDIQQTGLWSDFTLNGDAAPNDRFNYRARLVAPDSSLLGGDPAGPQEE